MVVQEKKQTTATEDILNSILPPREWTSKGELWVQYVSSTPATRTDVENLQRKLEQQLIERQARETGLCAIRDELYAQCFDELIRQVTINCAERGLLLLRVRDEIRLTLNAYQTLYESSVAFGMRKALTAQHHKAQLVAKLSNLESHRDDLQRQIRELEHKIAILKQRDIDRQNQDKLLHEQQVAQFLQINDSLKDQLTDLLKTK